jgi:hypothetical protein
MLIPESQKQAAVDIIMKALSSGSTSSTGDRVLMNCMGMMTGEKIGFERDKWVEWWQNKDNKDVKK